MVKTVITPQDNNYNLVIPNSYLGKKIEILFYAVDEIIGPEKTLSTKLFDKYQNIFTKDDAESFDNHTKQIRQEWENI